MSSITFNSAFPDRVGTGLETDVWTTRLLMLFHLVLIGARVRLGPLPVESFFVVGVLAVIPVWRGLSLTRVDTVTLLVLALIGVRVLATLLDVTRYSDHLPDRLYFSAHRIVPLVAFLFLYRFRRRLLARDGLRIVERALIAGLLLHGLATLASVLWEPAMIAVMKLGRLLEATSARSVGGTYNVYSDSAYYGAVYRVSGLLKYPTVNAGFLAVLGSLAAMAYYRSRKLHWLGLFVLATACCLLTFSRGGLGGLALAWFAMAVIEIRSGAALRSISTTAGLIAGGFATMLLLGGRRSGAFLEIVSHRFSQFFELERFDSAQTKLESTSQFFEILVGKYLVLLYPGFGLNNFLLYWRGQMGFDESSTGFVSNAWLLYAYDCGIYYLLLKLALVAALGLRFLRESPGSIIVLLPLLFVVASDHFFATTLEMHSLFWVVLGILTLYLERDRQLAAEAGGV